MTTNECVFMEKGECSKSAEDCQRYASEAVLNSQKEIGEVCNDEVEINHAENDEFVAENDDDFCCEKMLSNLTGMVMIGMIHLTGKQLMLLVVVAL
ncbi:UNVERIFIED_CONTAM: hypothetical protein Sradi_5884100 [Sesamum radiatum]|uniref:Uncharacterized protein n=1 Tax=Sesamum radiatum TaxID=300843 RepID=A0AAW2KS59_SESRA